MVPVKTFISIQKFFCVNCRCPGGLLLLVWMSHTKKKVTGSPSNLPCLPSTISSLPALYQQSWTSYPSTAPPQHSREMDEIALWSPGLTAILHCVPRCSCYFLWNVHFLPNSLQPPPIRLHVTRENISKHRPKLSMCLLLNEILSLSHNPIYHFFLT